MLLPLRFQNEKNEKKFRCVGRCKGASVGFKRYVARVKAGSGRRCRKLVMVDDKCKFWTFSPQYPATAS